MSEPDFIRRVGRIEGCCIVLDTRLEALRQAIARREWDETEWQYDRVLRAALKLREEVAS